MNLHGRSTHALDKYAHVLSMHGCVGTLKVRGEKYIFSDLRGMHEFGPQVILHCSLKTEESSLAVVECVFLFFIFMY